MWRKCDTLPSVTQTCKMISRKKLINVNTSYLINNLLIFEINIYINSYIPHAEALCHGEAEDTAPQKAKDRSCPSNKQCSPQLKPGQIITIRLI